MKASKMTLIAVLAVGSLLALSPALTAAETNTPPSTPPPGGPGMRGRPSPDMLAQQLKLSDDQKPKFKAALDEQLQKMRDLRQDQSLSQDDRRAKMRSIREDTNKKMKTILTDEQYAKWEKMGPGGPGGPRGPRPNAGGGTNKPPAAPPAGSQN